MNRWAVLVLDTGTRLWQGYGINYPAGVARIHDPFLYAGIRRDWRAPLKEALRIFHRVGARAKRTALYPGSHHGWDMIERSRFARQGRTRVLQWIAGRPMSQHEARMPASRGCARVAKGNGL